MVFSIINGLKKITNLVLFLAIVILLIMISILLFKWMDTCHNPDHRAIDPAIKVFKHHLVLNERALWKERLLYFYLNGE
jgi:hypothetical protein